MTDYSDEDLQRALQKCESEPIHLLGQIQPHGCLLVLNNTPDLEIVQASENCDECFGLNPEQVCGMLLRELLGQEQARQIESLINGNAAGSLQLKTTEIEYRALKRNLKFHAQVNVSVDMVILELVSERFFKAQNNVTDQLLQLQQKLAISAAELEGDQYFGKVAHIVSELLNFDRVMIYQFDNNWDGEVIAESKQEGMDSYLGNRFPAGDIPPQARLLYTKNLVRYIADSEVEPVSIYPTMNPVSNQPLDMSQSSLRSLSSVHVEYLRNMGVRASLSISLLKDGRLWGLIACHNNEPKYLSHIFIESCMSVSYMVSSYLQNMEMAETSHLEAKTINMVSDLLKSITVESSQDVVQQTLSGLRQIIDASGSILITDDQVYTNGKLPSSKEVEQLIEWIGTQPENNAVEKH